MTDPSDSPVTDPTALYAIRDSLYAADMLIAAVSGLDFFTWLDSTPAQSTRSPTELGFHRRPVDVMTTLFVAMGLVERDGARLRTAATAREHLVAHAPWYLGPYYPKVADRPIARDLIEILRTGAPARFASRADEADWHRAMETETFAEEFTAAMNCRGLFTAPALARHVDAGRHRLLDIAGGSGIFACAFAGRFPALRASVLEKPPVDRIAARGIAQRGLGDRVDTVVGDMLAEPLPGGYDVHLFSNVLHDWDEDIVRQLLAHRPPRWTGRAADRPRHVPQRDENRPAADRRILRAADARDPGALLFGRRDRVVADRCRLLVPRPGPERDRPERDCRGAGVTAG